MKTSFLPVGRGAPPAVLGAEYAANRMLLDRAPMLPSHLCLRLRAGYSYGGDAGPRGQTMTRRQEAVRRGLRGVHYFYSVT